MQTSNSVSDVSMGYIGRGYCWNTPSVKSVDTETLTQLKMARFSLLIFAAIYLSGIVASEPLREEGLGALRNNIHAADKMEQWSNAMEPRDVSLSEFFSGVKV